ncbi:pyridoxal 4-dehydrogenase, SDR-type [Conexibacter woesei]|uniref:Short-chain dehydrogenase/reductase SDR n=1 Tax=Conexibacter woesei (strain DSM 14684 / CCUG 47730 / CIP 108061 / JCM 11494 / NBRC 100937 / ID131577) TaxID=469383 RepID=D3F4U0_CONWI|nr:SDR family NAD(P)-dependent oxidoreductase [Conexibacter woesei]ADB52547.1 short-chain dehydrogenase/reductase SDR [Conexibacter woesei DSM 14684]
MGKLDNRVAIVTGAAQGIGRAIAGKLVEEGATVVVADLNGDGAAKAAEELGGVAVQADVSVEADAQKIVDTTLERHGRVDVLVHAAAIVPFVPWDEVDFAYWRKIVSVNLDGTYLVGRAVEKPMRAAGYGRIVNIASNSFFAGTPNMGPYVAAKGGVIGLTRVQATELGKYGITSNAVAPGIIRSEGALATPHKDSFDFVQALQALPRHGHPADIAPAVSFLASEESGWVTGQTLVVDAGHIRD